MKGKITSATLLLALCLAGILINTLNSIAQDVKEERPLSKDLSYLNLEYEVMISELEKPLDALVKNYKKRLDSIATELQKQGDLSGILAVKAEIEEVKESGDSVSNPPKTGEPRQLVAARAIFLKTQKSLKGSMSRKAAPLTKVYRQKLERFKSEYGKQGKIEDALAAKKLIDTIPTPESPASSLNEKRKLKIKVQIDGLSFLKMRGSEIWFDHTNGSYALPGQHSGSFPATLDGTIEWKPKWNGKITERYDAGISLPTKGEKVSLNLRMSKGRGIAKVIEHPSKNNDYTATIEMRDAGKNKKGFFGSDWMEFRLWW